jgi:hypothetical protein
VVRKFASGLVSQRQKIRKRFIELLAKRKEFFFTCAIEALNDA